MSFHRFNPAELGEPIGYTNGLAWSGEGRVLFVAGQAALDREGDVVSGGFVEQFAHCLDRVLAVVEAAGGSADHIGRMTVYVTDMDTYHASRRELGGVWRKRMGTHYPAMALVAVTELVDEGAVVEIEATAIVP